MQTNKKPNIALEAFDMAKSIQDVSRSGSLYGKLFAIKDMQMVDLRNFFNENIKGENYNVMVIGNENDLDFTALNTLGKVQKMDVDYLFNYEKHSDLEL